MIPILLGMGFFWEVEPTSTRRSINFLLNILNYICLAFVHSLPIYFCYLSIPGDRSLFLRHLQQDFTILEKRFHCRCCSIHWSTPKCQQPMPEHGRWPHISRTANPCWTYFKKVEWSQIINNKWEDDEQNQGKYNFNKNKPPIDVKMIFKSIDYLQDY